MSETAALTECRLAASVAGCRLWRNNRGAGYLTDGTFVRWGLANESDAMNRAIKSADLIGIRPLLIGPQHVGTIVGQFLSVEVKAPGWRPRPNDAHEQAQRAWADLVNRFGGDASFSTGEFK